MSDEKKPLAGAMRAAIMLAEQSWPDEDPALVIERESGLRELVEAVEWYFNDHQCGRLRAGKKCHGCAKIAAILKCVRET